MITNVLYTTKKLYEKKCFNFNSGKPFCEPKTVRLTLKSTSSFLNWWFKTSDSDNVYWYSVGANSTQSFSNSTLHFIFSFFV